MTVSSQWLPFVRCWLDMAQRSRADGAGSDGVLEPLSLQMFAVRYRARLITVVAVRSVLARLGANVRAQTVPEAMVCLSL